MTAHLTLETACLRIVDCEHKTAPIEDDGDYFAVGTPAMSRNVIDYSRARRISRSTFEAWTRRLPPQRGDLLFAREAPVGPVVRIPDSENVAPGQRTVLLRPDPAVVDAAYLYYLLGSPAQQRLISAKASGSTVAHLNVAEVRSFRLPPLPHLREQRAIAEVLEALDDKIAVNDRLVDTADQLASTLTRASLGDERVPLKALATLTMGSSPAGTSYNEVGDGTVFYQGVRDFGVRSPTNRVWTTSPVRVAIVGDSLVSVRAPVGRLNLASETTCIGRGLAAASSLDGRGMSLFHILRDAPAIWEPFEAEGTVFGSINKLQLSNLLVPTVRGDLQVRLEGDLNALEGRIAGALAESQMLAVLRDTLLPQLMSGKLRVRDAEAVVGEVV